MLNFPDNPFILSNVAGNPCQKVCGAKDTQLSFRTVFDKFIRQEYPSTITGNIQPAGTTLDHELELSYCYYEKMDGGWYNKESDFICSGLFIRCLKKIEKSTFALSFDTRHCQITFFDFDSHMGFANRSLCLYVNDFNSFCLY